MKTIRIIPCLDVDDGVVVKGIQFRNLKKVGNPVLLGEEYYKQGADELVFLDVGASYKSRETMIDVIEKVASRIFIPFTVGGGIRTVEDMHRILQAGADKVSVCTAALRNPDILSEAADRFGSQCVVLSIDARKKGNQWVATMKGGREDTTWDVIEWAQYAEKKGAGEILLNSIDKDGTGEGYDLELTKNISEAVSIPVIASGGGGHPSQLVEAVLKGKADAVLIASILHYGIYTIQTIKEFMKKEGVPVR
jgi:cyclase